MTAEQRPGLFKGTAWYYARYRPGYPDDFFALVSRWFALDGRGRLLDLGCGPGLLALGFAGRFEEVTGMDPEAEMLAEARVKAAAMGIQNVTWIQAASYDLGQLRPSLGCFRLVTMGASFHWMDRAATLRTLDTMIEANGGVVLTGSGSVWDPRNEWQQAVKAVVQHWLGEQRRAGAGTFSDPQARHEQILLQESSFTHIERHILTYPLQWDIDGIIGHLYSTSFCSPVLLGEKKTPFEADLRRTLMAIEPDGRFEEEVQLEVILARRAPGVPAYDIGASGVESDPLD